ncbi:MAG: DMT family transporter [Oscillospiraceae bacterium]|nr:DMT family transporter [Oscillospiraceae bacterium]
MNSAKKKSLGRVGLFVATFIWGISFVLMKNVLSSVPPLYILAFRFCGAALILLPICAGKLKKLDKSYLFGGALMGLALLLGYLFQTYGLRQTTPGKNAFLTSVYCVIVPFLYWAYNKKRPDRYNVSAAIICLIGIGMISLDGDLRIGVGDALTIVCGFFYANHLVVTARFIHGRDPIVLAMFQFAFVGVAALIAATIFEPFPTLMAVADIWTLVFLTVISTAVCLLLQIFGQKYTPPSQAAVIMTVESVFGALSSLVILNEAFTFRLVVGFVLTFAAIVISETKLEFIRKSRV